MSMFKYFFNIENKEENRKLFKNLYIEKSEFFNEQGAYPVVYLSLKGIKVDTWENCLSGIKILLRELYEEYSFIKEKLSLSEQIEFDKIWLKKDDGEYKNALKTNPYLKMGIMTGIIRVIKAGIFSDLNNLKVYSILEKEYSDFFGFTQKEVEKALKDFNIEYELPEVKAWYDGYRFGNSISRNSFLWKIS